MKLYNLKSYTTNNPIADNKMAIILYLKTVNSVLNSTWYSDYFHYKDFVVTYVDFFCF